MHRCLQPTPRVSAIVLATLVALASGCASSPPSDLLTHQALDPETPAATLRSLAEHPDKQVRMAVALNAEAPPRLLAKLADDRNFDVVLKVAKHPNTPVATIVELASRGHPEVRAEVARNPGTPVRRVARLKNADPPMDLYTHPATRCLVTEKSPTETKAYKHREDLLDAALCAWTAALWSRWGGARCQILGLEEEAPTGLRPTIIAPYRA